MNSLRRHIMIQQGGGVPPLPSEYQEVEWIQGGAQQNAFIDTGYNPNNNTHIVFDAQRVNGTELGWMFGSRSTNAIFSLAFNGNINQWIFGWSDNVGNYFTPNPSPDYNRHIFEINKGVILMDNIELLDYNTTTRPKVFQCPYSLYLFVSHGSGTITALPSTKIYKVIIYENEVKVQHLIPCYRKSDNVAGMYDGVNDIFYTNTNTGSFIIGPDVN